MLWIPIKPNEKIGNLAAKVEAKPQQSTRECFTCGRSYIGGVHRFCSENCQAAFDNGLPPYAPLDPRKFYSLPIPIQCCGCNRQFDSKGLRCCSPDCERAYRQREDLEAELISDPFRAVKRKCEGCGSDIPNWRRGRRVSAKTRFCSRRCGDENRRRAL
jgi:hypothetical protein